MTTSIHLEFCPGLNDLLKSCVNEGPICQAVSFSNRDGIPSGPVALVVSKCSNVFIISSVVSSIYEQSASGDVKHVGAMISSVLSSLNSEVK